MKCPFSKELNYEHRLLSKGSNKWPIIALRWASLNAASWIIVKLNGKSRIYWTYLENSIYCYPKLIYVIGYQDRYSVNFWNKKK